MGNIKNFQQQKAIPFTDSKPILSYVPFSFGQMKKLQAIPTQITLTPALQTYLDVFIPANEWADYKQLIVKCWFKVDTMAPNQPGGPNYQEFYNIQGTGPVARGVPFNVFPFPTITEGYFERVFCNNIANGYELNPFGAPPNMAVSSADGTVRRLNLQGGGPPFNRNADAHFLFQMKTSFAGSTDVVVIRTAEAYIQSPLDLNRLPR